MHWYLRLEMCVVLTPRKPLLMLMVGVWMMSIYGWVKRLCGGWSTSGSLLEFFFFFQAEDGIRDLTVTGVQTCALPILRQADQGGPGRPGGRHWLLLGRRPELPLRHQQPVPWRLRRLLWAGSRRHEIGRASCRERV